LVILNLYTIEDGLVNGIACEIFCSGKPLQTICNFFGARKQYPLIRIVLTS
jgi:hypothetical protein